MTLKCAHLVLLLLQNDCRIKSDVPPILIVHLDKIQSKSPSVLSNDQDETMTESFKSLWCLRKLSPKDNGPFFCIG